MRGREKTPEGEPPVEWILLTSLPTITLEQAWERVEWYRHRWLVEDYHQCLKSGCRIEERQLQTVDGLIRLLGILSPLAVRLLQIRAFARQTPDLPASEGIEPGMLGVGEEMSGASDHDGWNLLDRSSTAGRLFGTSQRWSSRLANHLERLAVLANAA